MRKVAAVRATHDDGGGWCRYDAQLSAVEKNTDVEDMSFIVG